MDPNQQTTQQGAQIVNQAQSVTTPTPVSSSIPSGMGQEPKKGGGFLLVFLILLFIAVAVAGGIYYFFVLNGQTSTFTNQGTISPIPTQVPVPSLSDEQVIDSLDTGTVESEVVDIEKDVQEL